MEKSKKYNVGVIGAGSWGGTLGYLAAKNGHHVTLWSPDKREIDLLKKTRKLLRPTNIKFPKTLKVTSSLNEICNNSNVIIIAVPSKHFEATVKELKKQNLNEKCIILSATKGLINGGKLSPHDVLKRQLPKNSCGILSGPNIAIDIISEMPAITVIASKSKLVGKIAQEILSSKTFRVYFNDDIYGVEMAGAFKNVIAIAAGISDGLGFSISTKAALVGRGLMEMIRIAKKEGAKTETMYSAAGVGDLMATCYSPNSRNYRVGYQLGKGKKLKTILNELGEVAEGVETATSMYNLSKKHKLRTPIADSIYKIVVKNMSPKKMLNELLNRPLPKIEIDY